MSTNALDKITVLELMQRLAALGVTETFMCCVAGTYQVELDLGDDDHSRVILGTSRVDMIEAMSDLLVKLDAVDTMRSALRTADAADPGGARPMSTRSLMEIAADGSDPHAEFLYAEATRTGHADTDGDVLIDGATAPDEIELENCSLCKLPAHPSETNDHGDHEACADLARRGDEA